MKRFQSLLIAAAFALLGAHAQAADKMKPFFLASNAAGDSAAVVEEVRGKLGEAGFEVVGSVTPYPGATVLVVTNDTLKKEAAKSEFGVYGAAQRVSVTEHDGKIQVAYTNPTYMAAAYRMEGDLGAVSDALQRALGVEQPFGCEEECMTAKQLNGYHYTFGMP